MKIKIKSTSSNSETLNIYKELLKKYNPVETTIEYYAENYNETYPDPAYLIDVPSLDIIPELAEELDILMDKHLEIFPQELENSFEAGFKTGAKLMCEIFSEEAETIKRYGSFRDQ